MCVFVSVFLCVCECVRSCLLVCVCVLVCVIVRVRMCSCSWSCVFVFKCVRGGRMIKHVLNARDERRRFKWYRKYVSVRPYERFCTTEFCTIKSAVAVRCAVPKQIRVYTYTGP